MLTIISPAKRIKFTEKAKSVKHTIPDNLDKSAILIDILRKKNSTELQKLMDISPKIAEESVDRLVVWNNNFNTENASQAILSFSGDVFIGMKADTFNDHEFDFAQKHLRILSGLHGMLRPLDLIMPYRLEMGLKLQIKKSNNLYEFWGDIITKQIKESIKNSGTDVLVNLASAEYFKAIKTDLLYDTKLITPDFREFKNGKYKFIHVNGKKARGMMCNFIIKNKIEDVEQIKLFDLEGYSYNDLLSNENKWVFTRG
jgi:cytoplasmic iron level regulating protein YaaA (DUF328/UPF0246 family)